MVGDAVMYVSLARGPPLLDRGHGLCSRVPRLSLDSVVSGRSYFYTQETRIHRRS